MTGQDLVNKAETKNGNPYVLGTMVPKDDADYNGAFDCAELVSWTVYQTIKKLYGCEVDNSIHPEHADAGTVYWARDLNSGLFLVVPITVARATPGAILLRIAGDGEDGHIVFSKGDGTTIEAMGHKWGVCNGKVDGRRWNAGILLNEVEYASNEIQTVDAVHVIRVGINNNGAEVKAIQQALMDKGYSVGASGADGIFGNGSAAAVREFQTATGLVSDGEVGPQTKNALGL